MVSYDIVIVGGGMVGASLASALHHLPYRVALIDAAPAMPALDHRLIALSYGSCCLLENLKIWPLLTSHATPIKQLHVSHQGRFGITRICANELGLPTLGHLIPAKYINSALEAKLKSNSTELIRPATLENLTIPSNDKIQLSIKTSDGIQQLSTKILIGADGTNSTVRQLINIKTQTKDYEQTALVTITELQRNHKNIAYERFIADGAIAMLPLNQNTCATIWTDSNKKIDALMHLNDHEFTQALQKEFGYRLGRFTGIQKRYTYPLKMVLAETYQKETILLLGNAAHTLHPIASQGLNLALYEIAELVEHLEQQQTTSPNLSNWRYAANKQNTSIQLTQHLTWLFSTNLFPLNIARPLGMLGLDVCKQAKQFFMKKSMGREGRIPHLLQAKEYHEHVDSGY